VAQGSKVPAKNASALKGRFKRLSVDPIKTIAIVAVTDWKKNFFPPRFFASL
jgi:hypothetical protein